MCGVMALKLSHPDNEPQGIVLAAKRAGKHTHLNLPLLVCLGKLLITLLKVLDHLLLRILLEARHSLLHIVKTLVPGAYRVLVGLESSSIVVLPLVVACPCL